MNSHRNAYRSGMSHGSFRLFYFKPETAKFLLKKPNFRVLQSALIDSAEDREESKEENEPPAKQTREMSSNVSELTGYDGYNHWPIFISTLNSTRCKNETCFRKTYWKCSKCNVHLYLISNKNCFTQYHTNT